MIRYLAPLILGCLLSGMLVFGIDHYKMAGEALFPEINIPRIDTCVADVTKISSTGQQKVSELNEIAAHCYSRIRSQQLLNDFQIRRHTFAEQIFLGNVLMWLVVVITCSGVGLAAFQLFIAYNLALRGVHGSESHEVTITKEQIALKSSVSGIVILAISLGFFLVFVTYIYKFQEVDVDTTRSESYTGNHSLQSGGLIHDKK